MTPISAPNSASKQPHGTDRAQLAEAAEKFEAIFLRQMLAAARKTDFGGELLGGEGLKTFRTMQDEHFADMASKSGAFGLAKVIEAQLAQQVAPQTPLPLAGGVGGGPVATTATLREHAPTHLTPPASGRGTGSSAPVAGGAS